MNRLLQHCLAATLIALSSVTMAACEMPEQAEEVETEEQEDD